MEAASDKRKAAMDARVSRLPLRELFHKIGRVAQTSRSLHVCDEPERLKVQNRWQYGHAQNSARIADIKKRSRRHPVTKLDLMHLPIQTPTASQFGRRNILGLLLRLLKIPPKAFPDLGPQSETRIGVAKNLAQFLLHHFADDRP